jgi:hypothetical protein
MQLGWHYLSAAMQIGAELGYNTAESRAMDQSEECMTDFFEPAMFPGDGTVSRLSALSKAETAEWFALSVKFGSEEKAFDEIYAVRRASHILAARLDMDN